MEEAPGCAAQSPEDVVDTALRGLARGKSHVVSGWTNRVMTEVERLVPRDQMVTRVAGRMMRSRVLTEGEMISHANSSGEDR